jgi:phage anti-repressor protein
MNNLAQYERQFDGIAGSMNPYPVDFDDAWVWIGYTRKDHGLKVLLENFEENIDFCSRILGSKTGSGGHNKVNYYLTVDCFKSFCMMAGTEKGREVRQYYLTVEKKYHELRQFGVSAITERLDLIENAIAALAMTVNAGNVIKTKKQLILAIPRTKSFEDYQKEADEFIDQHFEYTGCQYDWIHVSEIWTAYIDNVTDHLRRKDFSSRLYKNGAKRCLKYNKEAINGVKLKGF